MNIPQQSMRLDRILGFTSNGRNSFICRPNTNKLIYIAGCVVVLWDPQDNRQQHLYSESKKAITTLAISDDGRFLAAADCGNYATIYVWDLSNMTLLTRFAEVNVEVSCLCFSRDNKTLVSTGYKQNNSYTLNIWDWYNQTLLATQKLATKIRAISFNYDNSYFVSVGDAHVKYWYLNCDQSSNDFPSITSSKSATLGEQRASSFCDVKCGKGSMSNSTFCITKNGLLCEINDERLLHKWVDLRTTGANSLAVGDSLIAVGCANGVVRCFNPADLRFLKNLPRPHQLGLDPTSKTGNAPMSQANSDSIYPSVTNVCFNEEFNLISCLHNDRSLYIWDLGEDGASVSKRFAALYHSSCIWGIDMYPSTTSAPNAPLPIGSFITCSSDDTLRIWNPDNSNGSLLSGELLKIIFTDSNCKYLCDLEGTNQTKADENYDSNEGLRCLRTSPNGRQLAVGSRSGAIRIFDFERDIEIKNIAAHDAEVLCLEYSDPSKFDGYCYLASSSRDKLIHIFDANDDYNFLQTIDDHLSSITALRFVNNRARDCLQLISCGADSRIIFRNGVELNEQINFVPDQHIEGKNTFYDMEVDSDSSCLMAACQDRMIRLFNVAQVKYQSGFRGSSSDEGTIIKIALDPSCTFLATSSTDKSINIYDYQRGECIASIVDGLSDLVTDMKFSPDGRNLVACTGDGCIFIWKSPPEIANAIGGNLGIGQLSLASCSLDPSNTSISKRKHPALLQNKTPNPVKYSSEEALYDDLTMINKRYQVQSAQLNGSDDKQVSQGSSSQLLIRNQSSATSSSKRTSEYLQRSTPKAASAFKSRDNLDKILSREKFVTQNLVAKSSRKNITNNNSSLSGQFNTKQSHDNVDDRLEPIKTSHHLSRNYDGSSDDELQSDDNRSSNVLSVQRPITPPKPSLHRQAKRGSQTRDQHDQHHDYGRATKTVGRRLNLYQTPNKNTSTMRSSRSECNLKFNQEDDETLFGLDVQKSDLFKLHPSVAPINKELCQYVVDKLEEISKYALVLHQRLSNNEVDSSLSNILAQGARRSIPILSKMTTVSSNLDSATLSSAQTSTIQQQHLKSSINLTTLDDDTPAPQIKPEYLSMSSSSNTPSLTESKPRADGERLQTANELNLLEAYSDRLFKLLQERVAGTTCTSSGK